MFVRVSAYGCNESDLSEVTPHRSSNVFGWAGKTNERGCRSKLSGLEEGRIHAGGELYVHAVMIY